MRLLEGIPRTLLLAGMMAVAACHPSPRSTAPHAERSIVSDLVIALDGEGVVLDADGSSRIPGHGPAAFRITATSKLNRQPYPGEDLKAVLTTGERVVTQVGFTYDARRAKTTLHIPEPGTYRLEIWAGEHFIVGNTFVAASLPSANGRRVLELHQDAAPRLFITRGFEDGKPTFTGNVRLMHWDAIDSDTGYIAEWWLDGRRVAAAGRGRSDLQKQVLLGIQIARDELDLTAWKWATERFELPDHLPSRPGHWELRVFREHHPALAFGFEVTERAAIRGAQHVTIQDGSVELVVSVPALSKAAAKAIARELAQLPRETFQASSKYALGVTVEEVRALTRSEELRRLRLRLNELQRSWPGGPADAVSGEEPPHQAEMKRLVPVVKKLIGALGEPWTDEERPRSGRRG